MNWWLGRCGTSEAGLGMAAAGWERVHKDMQVAREAQYEHSKAYGGA